MGGIILSITPGNSSSEREQGMNPQSLQQITLTCVLPMANTSTLVSLLILLIHSFFKYV